MRILVLAGGIGGARFLLGVRSYAREAGADVTAVVNIGDDVTIHGLRICPDLDSVMYTLGDGADPVRGWGRRDETWAVRDELAAYGAEPTWFGLGDRDVATHLVRTRMLADGHPLTDVTAELCRRWQPGVRLLPASDDRCETHVVLATPGGPDTVIHFQEWWIRHRAALPVSRFVFTGVEAATPAPGVLDAIAAADVVLVAPSNPVVSIAPILAIPGIREALADAAAPVVGVSPIIGAAAVRGMADQCLAAIGVECSAAGVGRFYGSRAVRLRAAARAPIEAVPAVGRGVLTERAGLGGLLDGWLVDTVDAETTVDGVAVASCPLLMVDEAATVAMVRAALELTHG